jgi:hypothetical protein
MPPNAWPLSLPYYYRSNQRKPDIVRGKNVPLPLVGRLSAGAALYVPPRRVRGPPARLDRM